MIYETTVPQKPENLTDKTWSTMIIAGLENVPDSITEQQAQIMIKEKLLQDFPALKKRIVEQM